MSCFDHWFVKHKDRFGIGRERERERERERKREKRKRERERGERMRRMRRRKEDIFQSSLHKMTGRNYRKLRNFFNLKKQSWTEETLKR